MDLGFHSLVELLVRHVTDQATKNKALDMAISKRRLSRRVVTGFGARFGTTGSRFGTGMERPELAEPLPRLAARLIAIPAPRGAR